MKRGRFKAALSSSAAWIGGGLLVTTGATFFTNVLVVQAASLSVAGDYFLAFSVVAFGSIVLRLGLDKSIVKYAEEANSEGGRAALRRPLRYLFQTHVSTFLLLLLAFSSGVWDFVALDVFHSRSLAGSKWGVFIWMVSETPRLTASEYLRGVGLVREATVLGNPGRAVLLLTAVALCFFSEIEVTLSLLVSVSWIASLTCLVVASCLCFRFTHLAPKGRSLGAASTRSLGSFLAGSGAFYVASCWSFASNGSDVLIAGAHLDADRVAQYAAAVKLTQLLGLGGTAAALFLAPKIPALLRAGMFPDLERLARSSATFVSVPMVLVALIFTAGSELTVSFIYPPSYSETAVLLAILTLGPLSTALTGPNVLLLLMSRHGPIVSIVTTVVTSIHLLLMLVAVLSFGSLGLALASSLGTVALNLAFSIVLYRKLGLRCDPYWTLGALRRGLVGYR